MRVFDETIPLNSRFELEQDWLNVQYMQFIYQGSSEIRRVEAVEEGVFKVRELVKQPNSK
jgi:hypothetical protein